MQFKPNYPIYLQVADYLCEKILTDAWHNGDKIPSVKELSVLTSVNPNTVIKSLTWLQDNDIVNTQRGIGYFLTDKARSRTIAMKRNQFIREDLPDVFNTMQLLDVSMDDLKTLYEQQEQIGGGE
jgi:DNA-binding transcriptional regulator YhcF (GntR family)